MIGVVVSVLGLQTAQAQHAVEVREPTLVGSALDDCVRLLTSNECRRLSGRTDIGEGPWHTVSRRAGSLQLPARQGVRELFAPTLGVTVSSRIPSPLDAGGLLVGRGLNASATVGARVKISRVVVQLLPQILTSENRDFRVTPLHDPRGGPQPWRFPFVVDEAAIDLPLRFGPRPITTATWGQSTLAMTSSFGEIGVSHEVRWWGPGRRNALLLGNQHQGFPHVYLETERRLGSTARVRLELLNGQLRESPFFDTIATNDRRGITAVQLAFMFRGGGTGFSVGLQRMVLREQRAGLFDAFRHVETDDGRPTAAGAQQAAGAFARYSASEGRSEAWVEWLRFEEPVSLRDALEYPGRSQGYTAGLAWLPAQRTRVEAEFTNLEPDASHRRRPIAPSYAGTRVPQGFTNRGRPLGAAIGPGSSSQWLALDHFRDRGTRYGAYLQRVRWHNAYRRDARLDAANREDVSLIVGVRADRLQRLGSSWGLSYSAERRLNYLFASSTDGAQGSDGPDRFNHVFRITVAPMSKK
jgi:hypothetical protein